MDEPLLVEAPIVIMYDQGDDTICRLHQLEKYTYEHYGMFICDIVRHVATAYVVEEDAVWEWVDKERHHHTTEIRRPS